MIALVIRDTLMMCISLSSFGRPIVQCMGVRLGIGWVLSGQLSGGSDWVWSMKID